MSDLTASVRKRLLSGGKINNMDAWLLVFALERMEANDLHYRKLDELISEHTRSWAEMYCTLRKAERRIRKHRRIITRLLGALREKKEKCGG